jgi:hypothetical protein
MITNYQEYYKLVEYFSEFTKARIGLAMGVASFIQIFDEKYYRNLSGGILEAFGKLFFKDLKVYLYPFKNDKSGEIVTSENLRVHPRMKELYKFFKYNGKVVDIKDYDPDILTVFSKTIIELIASGTDGWEEMVPTGVADIIKEERLFGYSRRKFIKAK